MVFDGFKEAFLILFDRDTMLAIRFNRTGKKNQASFRVVLQDKRKAPGRRHVEILGSWNPHTKEAVLKGDRILHWIGLGAEVSDSVHNLLVKQQVIEGKRRAIKMPKPAVKEALAVVEETPKEEAKAEAVTEASVVEEAPVAEAAVEEKAAEVPAAKEETPAKA
jgi:small subunit ribosomal protein S16